MTQKIAFQLTAFIFDCTNCEIFVECRDWSHWSSKIFCRPRIWKDVCEVENVLLIHFSLLLYFIGVHYVFDTTIAADFSILESQREFVQRYQRRNQEEHALPMFASACPGENWFLQPSSTKELRVISSVFHGLLEELPMGFPTCDELSQPHKCEPCRQGMGVLVLDKAFANSV